MLDRQLRKGRFVDHEFTGEIWYWRGPSPFLFVTVPPDQTRQIQEIATEVSYGWGMVPVTARIGGTEWTTSLFPKDGSYLVPIKVMVQRAEGLALGDVVTLGLSVTPRRPRG